MTNVIDLVVPTSQTITEKHCSEGIVIGYIDGKPHGLITVDEYNNYIYSRVSLVSDWYLTEESFDELMNKIMKEFPNISFKLFKTQ